MLRWWWWSDVGINTGILADTASISSIESNVSCLSPWSSPWVLDLPVSTDDSDEEDGVVDSWTAVAEDSWSVWAPVGGIDGDWDGGVVDLAGKTIASWETAESWDLVGSSLGLAGLILGSVGVGRLSGDSVGFNVVEGAWWPSSVASLVSLGSWAVDELLLWEVDWLSL